jgi:magnesium chelatase subunit H
MEAQGILPIPIFINGVEAHTIVRDLLTSQHEIHGVARGTIVRDKTYQGANAARVDAIVSTIDFPLVGGPAGSMEAGRNVEVTEMLLRNMNVPYFVASPLKHSSMEERWCPWTAICCSLCLTRVGWGYRHGSPGRACG